MPDISSPINLTWGHIKDDLNKQYSIDLIKKQACAIDQLETFFEKNSGYFQNDDVKLTDEQQFQVAQILIENKVTDNVNDKSPLASIIKAFGKNILSNLNRFYNKTLFSRFGGDSLTNGCLNHNTFGAIIGHSKSTEVTDALLKIYQAGFLYGLQGEAYCEAIQDHNKPWAVACSIIRAMKDCPDVWDIYSEVILSNDDPLLVTDIVIAIHEAGLSWYVDCQTIQEDYDSQRLKNISFAFDRLKIEGFFQGEKRKAYCQDIIESKKPVETAEAIISSMQKQNLYSSLSKNSSGSSKNNDSFTNENNAKKRKRIPIPNYNPLNNRYVLNSMRQNEGLAPPPPKAVPVANFAKVSAFNQSHSLLPGIRHVLETIKNNAQNSYSVILPPIRLASTEENPIVKHQKNQFQLLSRSNFLSTNSENNNNSKNARKDQKGRLNPNSSGGNAEKYSVPTVNKNSNSFFKKNSHSLPSSNNLLKDRVFISGLGANTKN
jgi:hypothetical protein